MNNSQKGVNHVQGDESNDRGTVNLLHANRSSENRELVLVHEREHWQRLTMALLEENCAHLGREGFRLWCGMVARAWRPDGGNKSMHTLRCGEGAPLHQASSDVSGQEVVARRTGADGAGAR